MQFFSHILCLAYELNTFLYKQEEVIAFYLSLRKTEKSIEITFHTLLAFTVPPKDIAHYTTYIMLSMFVFSGLCNTIWIKIHYCTFSSTHIV